MAARALLQRRAAPLAASMLVGAVAFSPKLALAEAPESHNSHSRKPIYDDFDAVPTTATLPPAKPATRPDTPSSSTTLAPESPASPSLIEVSQPQQYQRHGPTPTDRLAAQIRDVRLFIYRHACTAEDAVNRTMDRAFHLEKSFTDTIASLAPPPESGEKLMPGLVYVLVAAMAGSIVTRRSNILLRATVPVAFGVGMGWTAIPHTMRNTSDLAWKYEQRYPVVAQGHLQIKDSWRQGVSFARVHTQLGRDKLEEKVKGARETVEEWVRKGK